MTTCDVCPLQQGCYERREGDVQILRRGNNTERGVASEVY